jgi:hypothetical protein
VIAPTNAVHTGIDKRSNLEAAVLDDLRRGEARGADRHDLIVIAMDD